MKKIVFQGREYSCKDSETVLDALLRANVNMTFSCRNGICHSCLLQAKSGTPSEKSQIGLKPSLVKNGYFLACRCHPQSDLEIVLPRVADIYGRATICAKEKMTEDIWRLYLEPATSLYYHPGQFINIRREDGVSRSFSLASVANEDILLELHIKRLPGGQMSQWLIDDAVEGSELDFQGPLGDCYYRNNFKDRKLLLVCSGTGLAPMIGILRDALNQHHAADIYLYHGSSKLNGLYLTEYLRNFETLHPNFHYIPCLSQETAPDVLSGRASDIAFARHPNLEAWSVYIAGNPDMAYQAELMAKQNGVNVENLFVDPFEFNRDKNHDASGAMPVDTENKIAANDIESVNTQQLDPPYPEPDPEMWQALEQGKLLSRILDDFYSQVYADEKLKGFFKDTSKRRSIEKQYNFLHRVFTGEKVYFGEKPRNAHNWMIISKELFDYREQLMQSCLRKHGLSETMIERWMRMEYRYLNVIVKNKVWKKVVDGVEYPVDGFGEIVTEVGTLCDACHREVSAGETITYHLRTGEVYCNDCKNGSDKLSLIM